MKQVIKLPIKILKPVKDYLFFMQRNLEKRKKRLEKEDPFKDTTRVDDNAASDTDAAEISGHDRIEALRYEVEKALITVRKAMTKIKIGKYGICESCGKLIDTDRLAANPTAEFCMNCEKMKNK